MAGVKALQANFHRPVPKQREETFAKAGIAAFHGRARFIAATAIQVDNEVLEARRIVVAAGAKPANLKIPGKTS